MANLRSIASIVFAACLFLVLPGFVSAQDVYEAQSGDSYVTIGTHESGANMEKIVALAQRLTDNAELTSEDVLANLSHARRYVCRAHGRQIYFGTDPAYAGRCPEGATRFDGVFGNWHYRVPRVHGDVLSPMTRRRTSRPAAFEPPDPRIAAYESTSELLEDTVSELAGVRAELVNAQAELATANAALANDDWPELHTVAVPAPIAQVPSQRGEVSADSLFYGRPLWVAFAVLVTVMIALFLLVMLIVLRFKLKPHLAYREILEKKNTRLEGQLMETASFLRTMEEDYEKEQKTTQSLKRRRARLIKAVVFYRILRGRADADLKREKALLSEYRFRRDRIVECHDKLVVLRVQEEPFLHAESLVQETMADREDAEHRHDEDLVARQDELLQIYEAALRSWGDPQRLRAEINGLVTTMKHDMQLQCGLYFDTRSSDEWRAERDNEQRTLKRELGARIETYSRLATALAEAKTACAEEHAMAMEDVASLKREIEFTAMTGAVSNRTTELEADLEEHKQLLAAMLGEPDEHVKQLIAYDNREADLRKRLVDAGLDPGLGTKLYALIAGRHGEDGGSPDDVSIQPLPRRQTQAIEALRPSQLPAPPSSPTSALNQSIYTFLDALRSLPIDSWRIECNEAASRDWAYFLYNCWISAPGVGVAQLSKYTDVAKRLFPEWVTERARQPTGRPSV